MPAHPIVTAATSRRCHTSCRPCRAGALADDQPQMSPGRSAPRRSTRHETTTGILPLTQPSSSVKSRKLTARLQDTRIGRCYLAPERTTCLEQGVCPVLASIPGGSFVVRITEVSTLKLRFSMATPMADAIHYMPERNLLLVQVATDDGLVGLGECAAY